MDASRMKELERKYSSESATEEEIREYLIAMKTDPDEIELIISVEKSKGEQGEVY